MRGDAQHGRLSPPWCRAWRCNRWWSVFPGLSGLVAATGRLEEWRLPLVRIELLALPSTVRHACCQCRPLPHFGTSVWRKGIMSVGC
jgi:hypothetical protein